MLLKLPAENLAIPLKVIHNGMKNPQQSPCASVQPCLGPN